MEHQNLFRLLVAPIIISSSVILLYVGHALSHLTSSSSTICLYALELDVEDLM